MSSLHTSSGKNNFQEPISAEQMFRLAFSLPRDEFDRLSCRGWKPVTGLPVLNRPRATAEPGSRPEPATGSNLPADVLVFNDQENLVVEFPLATAIGEDICLAMADNILVIDWCSHGQGGATEPGSGQFRRRCIILPPDVSPAQIKARIVNQRLRIEVCQNAPFKI